MQVAAKDALWGAKAAGGPARLELVMTVSTGLHIRLCVDPLHEGMPWIDWGDGSPREFLEPGTEPDLEHDYPSFGTYTVRFGDVGSVGFDRLDNWSGDSFRDAVVALVDPSGQFTKMRSGSFTYAHNLETVVAPNAAAQGQGNFRYCERLKTVEMPKACNFFDQTFAYCTALETIRFEAAGTLWSGVFYGCSSLREVRLGAVDQISDGCFSECPALQDVWISNHTVDEVMQRAPDNNVVGGYGAEFPYGANMSTRFHCSDGVVLGDGTLL